MHLNIPSGYFLDSYCVFGDPGAGCILSRSYEVAFPDLSASDDQAHADLEGNIRLMLGSLRPDEHLQLSYYTSNEFGRPLDRFGSVTAKSQIPICTKVRNDLEAYFRQRMAAEELIQANVRLSLSTKMPKFLKEDGRKVQGFQDVFKVMKRSFDQREQFFNLLLSTQGGSVKGLENRGHYEELLRFWSPGQVRQPPLKDLDWLRTIEDLCRFSGLSPRHAPDHGFYLDGYYFGVLVAKTFPRATWAKTMQPFLSLTIPNLRVVLNMRPISVEAEIQHEEDRYGKLASNLDPQSPSLQSEVGLQTHRERMTLLMSNKIIPFKAQLIIIACERTPEKLDQRMEALRAALGKTGCESIQPALATSTVSFFNAATPGFGPWVGYPDYWAKLNDAVNVANMWAAGSTPCGDLKEADWLADGDQNNAIGGKCFNGSQPAHMLCAATTGAGKSVLNQSIALQTAPMFGLLVVIDDGLSWMTTCHKLDPSSRPIIVRSGGNLTFNPLDTRGLPRSSHHDASATALCHLLVGVSGDEDRDKLRHAVLSETINSVYTSAYRKWRNANPEAHFDLCLSAASLMEFQAKEGLESFVDAFVEARAKRNAKPFNFETIDAEAAVALDRNPKTEHLVQNLAFASWTPEMFPTLSDIQDELHTASLQRGPHQEMCATLASLLRPWLRDGIHGPIVDGVGNIDLGSVEIQPGDPLKVVHFDLGEISKAEDDLRAVAGFLIANEVRSHIEGMNRGVRKQIILEELTGFLKVPNAREIVCDFYERMRKFSAQVTSIFQQYSTLLKADPKVASAMIGNASNLILMRNHNRKDLEVLSGFLPRPLPEVIIEQITRFPKPAELEPEKRYSGFVLCSIDGEDPRYVVGRNYISAEVEAITSSSGSDFESKRKALRQNVKDHQGSNGNGAHPPSRVCVPASS
jgi:hypothetical protein